MNYSIFFEAGFIGAKNYIKKMKKKCFKNKNPTSNYAPMKE